MIICHCNRIRSAGIDRAVGDALQIDCYAVITPGTMFKHCGSRPVCGG